MRSSLQGGVGGRLLHSRRRIVDRRDLQDEALVVRACRQVDGIVQRAEQRPYACLVIHERDADTLRTLRDGEGVIACGLDLHAYRYNRRLGRRERQTVSAQTRVAGDGEDIRLARVELLGHVFAKLKTGSDVFVVREAHKSTVDHLLVLLYLEAELIFAAVLGVALRRCRRRDAGCPGHVAVILNGISVHRVVHKAFSRSSGQGVVIHVPGIEEFRTHIAIFAANPRGVSKIGVIDVDVGRNAHDIPVTVKYRTVVRCTRVGGIRQTFRLMPVNITSVFRNGTVNRCVGNAFKRTAGREEQLKTLVFIIPEARTFFKVAQFQFEQVTYVRL